MAAEPAPAPNVPRAASRSANSTFSRSVVSLAIGGWSHGQFLLWRRRTYRSHAAGLPTRRPNHAPPVPDCVTRAVSLASSHTWVFAEHASLRHASVELSRHILSNDAPATWPRPTCARKRPQRHRGSLRTIDCRLHRVPFLVETCLGSLPRRRRHSIQNTHMTSESISLRVNGRQARLEIRSDLARYGLCVGLCVQFEVRDPFVQLGEIEASLA
jgi:hypothetical protein